jgi:two-component system response regulator PilR (NtrC family)
LLRLPDGKGVRIVGDLVIGQSSECDVTIRDPSVSRKHCSLELVNYKLIVRDLGSTNGTRVNGARVTIAEVKPGAVLDLGSSRLRVVVDASHSDMLGESVPMRRLRDEIAKLAGSSMALLVHGETGTGKELVAMALHRQSGRTGQFVPVNCGSIPKELVESELFGHEKGAFTGAHERRQGVFQEADGGTLFLDEIGELPLTLQTRLLRVLETGMVRPVGSNREIAVAVRVIAATHVNLRAAVRASKFRGDLYFRLGAEIGTPPLRDRREDIPMLAQHFLDEFSAQAGACRLGPGALEALLRHHWPGNVRELRHVLQRAVVLNGPVVEERDFGFARAPVVPEEERVRIDGRPYLEIERDIIRWAYFRANKNRTLAAQSLRIPKSTLCDKVKRYRIDAEDND